MAIEIKVSAGAAIAALTDLTNLLGDATHDAVRDTARDVQAMADRFAPKGLGTLAGSIYVDGPSPITGLTGYIPKGIRGVSTTAWAAQIGPTVVYGRIRELGGRIPQKPMSHPYLRWIWNGHYVFKHSVHQKGTHYLKDAARLTVDELRVNLVRTARDAILSV